MTKILWITAQRLPLETVSDIRQLRSTFGGWTIEMLKELETKKYELGLVVPGDVPHRIKKELRAIAGYILPIKTKEIGVSQEDINFVINDFKPDIIQIEGTEFEIQAQFSGCDTLKLVSLQGMLYGYDFYQNGLLPMEDLLKSRELSIKISANALLQRKKKCQRRIEFEDETLKNANAFIGRTSWDRAYSYWVNPNVKYYSCNRILRSTFYGPSWSSKTMEEHVIYTSNGSTALKGLHVVLKAVSLLRTKYPNIKLRIAGKSSYTAPSIFNISSFGYPIIIRSIIKKYDLESSIEYLGEIDSEEVLRNLISANVYVLPSLIENSPNSLGEAMLVGTPSVCSYVGGVSDMAVDGRDALFYRASEPIMLAWQIKRIFDSRELGEKLSNNARLHAAHTHNRESCVAAQMAAYDDMIAER